MTAGEPLPMLRVRRAREAGVKNAIVSAITTSAILVAGACGAEEARGAWWYLSQSHTNGAEVFDRCVSDQDSVLASPADLYNYLKARGDDVSIVDRNQSIVEVRHTEKSGEEKYMFFYRTKETCDTIAAGVRKNFDEERRKLDKYR